MRAIDLLYAMCDHTNAKAIVEELMNYLQKADYGIRETLVRGRGCGVTLVRGRVCGVTLVRGRVWRQISKLAVGIQIWKPIKLDLIAPYACQY